MPRKGAFSRCVESVSERGGASDPRAVCAASIAGKRGRTRGRVNPSLALVQAAAGAGEQSGREWRGKAPSATSMDKEFRNWLEYRRNSMPEIQGLTAAQKKQLRASFFRGVRQGYGSANPKGYTANDLVTVGKTAVMAHVAPWTLIGNKGKKKNPRSRKNHHNEKAALEAYRDFHGREPDELVEFETVTHFPGRTAAIGDLVSLSIRIPKERMPDESAAARTVDLSDFGDAWLTRHPTKRQLYVEGGDQSVDLAQFGLDESDPHELEYLGELVRCVYFTRKDHLGDEGGEANYHHKFGTNELTLKKTELVKVAYSVPESQLVFVGGGYEIPAEGIDG